MFYSAHLEAFGPWWFFGFFGVIVCILLFALIFYLIKKQTEEERYASNSKYRKFVKSFKREYWYWEFILFSRRFFIALFTSIQFVGGDYTNFIFVIILIIYFGLQIQFKPFAFTRVNRIETLCLIMLLAAVVSVYFVDIDSNDAFIATILSFCILVPLLIVAFYAVQIIRKRRLLNELDYNDQQHTHRLNQGVNRMMRRTPKSFRDVVKQTSTVRNWQTLEEMSPQLDQEQNTNTSETGNSDEVIMHTSTNHGDINSIQSNLHGMQSMMATQIEMNQIVSSKVDNTPTGNPSLDGLGVQTGKRESRERIRTKSFVDVENENDDDVNGNTEELDDILSMVLEVQFSEDGVEFGTGGQKEKMSLPTSTVPVAANLSDDGSIDSEVP